MTTQRLVSGKPQEEDWSLDTSLRPRRLADYVGQDGVKGNLDIAITAAKQRGEPLDHVLIYKGSNMGNSHRHAHEKVPVILMGGLDGTFKGNRHLVFRDSTERTSNLLLSILNLYGVERDSFGDSTGLLSIA